MTESSVRKIGFIEEDIISNLPRNIQETILCVMPLRDAVRTSILSTKWRHRWTTIPHLKFDFGFVESIWDQELKAFKFVTVINKVLLLHNGPILELTVNCPQRHCDAQMIHDYIDQWIPLLSRNGIKELTITYLKREEFTPHNFSSLDPTHLRLGSVWFPYIPAFRGFAHLTNLELIDVATSEQRIYDCPVLEKLTLIVCEGLFHTSFRAPNLKYLHQYYRQMTSKYSLSGYENVTEYSFRLSRNPTSRAKISNVVKVLGSLPKIEKFSVASCFIKYLAAGGSPNRLSKPLPCLKTLNISDINFNDLSEVSCLLCLIRSAPNLCKLHILAGDDIQGNLNEYRIQDSEDCVVDHLEIVTFSYFTGLKAEMELIKFLLAHAPLLKTMLIHRSPKMIKDVAFNMADEMLQYSRVSSRAQIRHLKHPVRIDDYGPWIPLLRRKDTKQLSLEYLERGEFSTHHLSKDLTHLRLLIFWCSSSPTYGGFPYLTNLELVDVDTSGQSIFDCPGLQKLALEEYSLAGLENLTEYSALYGHEAPMNLTNTCNVVEILSRLHKIEKFCVAMDFMQYLAVGGSPNRLSKPLQYLKTLNISDIFHGIV
ncbi:FBD domain-containing protein [Heracleum sosnowskyi]|uniref:FBD domain-containing protein n=1 Tax=Heracleum sosnowskyi TaxID=360622 RepID=A0AAD8HWJ2_9APIA|nr:FBD domain-containing protein [Heracleum sosnowskyi]